MGEEGVVKVALHSVLRDGGGKVCAKEGREGEGGWREMNYCWSVGVIIMPCCFLSL